MKMALIFCTCKLFFIALLIVLTVISSNNCVQAFKKFRAPVKCLLPKMSGTCQAAIPRWYFDMKTGHCQQFIYGGCGGNENNFRGERACQIACKKWIALGSPAV